MRLRNIAIVELLYSSGMRVGELVTLKREDVNYRERSAIVTGKGDKERVVFFYPRAWRALLKYWLVRGDMQEHRGIWRKLPVIGRHDRMAHHYILPMDTPGVRAVIAELERSAGIAKHVTPHSFRHNFATRVLGRTGDLAAVQDLLGHASPDTTRIYAEVSDRKKHTAHRLAFAPPERAIESEYVDFEMLQVIGLADEDPDPAPSVAGNLEPIGSIPLTESQARPLAAPVIAFPMCECWHPEFDHGENGACLWGDGCTHFKAQNSTGVN